MLVSKLLEDRLALDNDERSLQAGFRYQRGCRDQRCSLRLNKGEALKCGRTLYALLVDLEEASSSRRFVFLLLLGYMA